MWTRADARRQCRTWIKADLDERFCILLGCEPRRGRRQNSSEYRDYEEALDQLLAQLGDMHAVIDLTVACAGRGPKIFQGANNMHQGPIYLSDTNSIRRLRGEILDLYDLAEFYRSKKIAPNSEPIYEHVELYVSVPGHDPSNVADLAKELRHSLTRTVDRGTDQDAALSGESDGLDKSDINDLDIPDSFEGELERKAWTRVRREQATLRNLLAGNGEQATCGLCGDGFPLEFLVAAHVKKRALCSDVERRDLANVAMLACVFGCDALFEAGWITVAADGSIRSVNLVGIIPGPLKERLAKLEGKSCAAHTVNSEPYFSWHRSTVFLKSLPIAKWIS